MTNSNDKIFLSVEATLEVLLNNVFEDLSFDKSKALSNPEMEKLASVFSYIFKENSLIKVECTKEDIELASMNNIYDIKNICRLFTESIYGRRGYRDNLQEDISRSFKNYYEWKQKYLSREKALEKYNTTVIAKEEEKIDPNVDRTIANISDKLSSIIEKNDNNINCILVHAVKLGLLETAESINILKQENKKLKDEIEMLKKGNFNKNMKFSDSQIRSIKNMNRYGIDIKRIAMEYNCSINDIKNIIEE